MKIKIVVMKKWIVFLLLFYLFKFLSREIYNFINNDLFNISEIEIIGSYSLLQNDVINDLMRLKGENIWLINEKELEEHLAKDIRVKKVSVEKTIPDKLMIKLEERKSFAYSIVEGKIYVCDESGNLFAYREETEDNDLIVIDEKSHEKRSEMVEIIKKFPKDLFNNVSELYIESSETVKLILEDGVVIKTNLEVTEEKYDTGFLLYLKLMEIGKNIEYVDLRFKDYIVK